MSSSKVLFSKRKGSAIFLDRYGNKTVSNPQPIILHKCMALPMHEAQQINLQTTRESQQLAKLTKSNYESAQLQLLQDFLTALLIGQLEQSETCQNSPKYKEVQKAQASMLLECSVLSLQVAQKKGMPLIFDRKQGSPVNYQLAWECLKLLSSDKYQQVLATPFYETKSVQGNCIKQVKILFDSLQQQQTYQSIKKQKPIQLQNRQPDSHKISNSTKMKIQRSKSNKKIQSSKSSQKINRSKSNNKKANLIRKENIDWLDYQLIIKR